jgi:hypothetical protein
VSLRIFNERDSRPNRENHVTQGFFKGLEFCKPFMDFIENIPCPSTWFVLLGGETSK